MFSPSQAGSRASNSSAAASMASRADNEVGVARAAAQLANKIPRSAGIPRRCQGGGVDAGGLQGLLLC